MENSKIFCLTKMIVTSLLLVPGTASPCENQDPIKETAYVGAYEVHFPSDRCWSGMGIIHCPFNTSYRAGQPSQCRWRISAYRKDYVINLDFIDVNLTQSSRDDTCPELVTVYDGSDVTDNVLATLCEHEDPSIVTSSRDTLVVFSSNETDVASGRFRLRYKAVKERASNEDSSQILRIAFGGFIGAIAFILICSGAIRKYNKGRPTSSVFVFFGRHRVNNYSAQPAGNGHGGASAANVETRGTTLGAPRGQERLSFRKRLADFFQDMVLKLSPRRLEIESSTSDSSDYSSSLHPQHQTGPRRNNRFGRSSASSTSCTDVTHISQARSSSSNNDSDFDPSSMSHIQLDGHENFGYQSIPISSFTSDPAAVKPPTYEDCINTVNPLYLHHHSGQAFYNRAFDLKDEDGPDIFSPPPPYSEIITHSLTHPSRPLHDSEAIYECPGMDQQRENITPHGETEVYSEYRCHSLRPLNMGTTGNSRTPVSILQSSDTLAAPEGIRNPGRETESTILDVMGADSLPEGADHPHRSSESNLHQPTAEGLTAGNLTVAPLALLRRSGFISNLPGEQHPNFSSASESDNRQKAGPIGSRADRKCWTLKPPDDLFSELATAQCSDTDQLFVDDSYFPGTPLYDTAAVTSVNRFSNGIEPTEESVQAADTDQCHSTCQRLNINGLEDIGEGHNA